MADPSPPFVLILMTWVFKEESFCTLITNSFFSQNIHSLSLTLLLPFKHPYPSSLTKPPHHVASEKSKLFLPQREDGCFRFSCRSRWGQRDGTFRFRTVRWGRNAARPRQRMCSFNWPMVRNQSSLPKNPWWLCTTTAGSCIDYPCPVKPQRFLGSFSVFNP